MILTTYTRNLECTGFDVSELYILSLPLSLSLHCRWVGSLDRVWAVRERCSIHVQLYTLHFIIIHVYIYI